MQNLYAAHNKVTNRPVNSHTVYLTMLAKEDPKIRPEFELVTTITHEDRKLFVLGNAGLFFLSDHFILGEGIANNLYSSHKLRRVMEYGKQLIQKPL